MDCPSCGCAREQEETFCDRCLTERQTTSLIINYFNRGYPYPAIVGLLLNAGVQISVRTLKRRLRSLGLRRKDQVIDEQYLREVIREEMEGAGRLSGYRNVWHALRLRHSINVSRHVVARIIKEIDPEGVESRKARRLHRRRYTSDGPNACWHIDGENSCFILCFILIFGTMPMWSLV